MELNVEILVALIGAFALLIGYLIQRQNELKLKITETKKEAYAEFLNDFTETAVAIMHDEAIDQITSDRQRMHARDQLLLYASDNVIKAYDNCRTYAFECRKSASAYRILVDMECTVQKTSTDIENKVSNA